MSDARIQQTAQLALLGLMSSGLRHVGPEVLAAEAVVYARALDRALAEATEIDDEVRGPPTFPQRWDPKNAWRALGGDPDGLLGALEWNDDDSVEWGDQYDRLIDGEHLEPHAAARLASWLLLDPGADVRPAAAWVRHLVEFVLQGEVGHGVLYALAADSSGDAPLDVTYWNDVAGAEELGLGARAVLETWLRLD